VSCATSIDGYIDDATGQRLLLSNDADFDRVDEVRAGCDAILVGATTIREDNPRLLVRSTARREARVARGLPATPIKVTLTGQGDLDPAAQFFTTGDTEKIVYTTSAMVGPLTALLGDMSTIVDAGAPVDLAGVLRDLSDRGVGKLLVEGGGSTHTQFLTAGLVDELHLVVAPFFVGDSQAPRFVRDGNFPWNRDHQARLAEVVTLDNVVLLRYALSDRYFGL
jgi:5-amino-6-(5-phosphoribosylamino)uracil reductase